MTSCGICCKTYTDESCAICSVNTCDKCYVPNIYTSVVGKCICMLCNRMSKRIDNYRGHYCKYCEYEGIPGMFYNKTTQRCANCLHANISQRALLPHFKANPIIEIYFIPDIAKLIFDYYYFRRRYFKGEYDLTVKFILYRDFVEYIKYNDDSEDDVECDTE